MQKSKKNLLNSFLDLDKEVSNAYVDCHTKYEYHSEYPNKGKVGTIGLRNLSFKANQSVDIKTAIEILEKYNVYYNLFEPKLLIHLTRLGDGEVYIARENSVCIYYEVSKFKNFDKEEVTKLLKCDELDLHENTYRIWWD